jgi:release factor glutamine methyltransferase
MVETTFYGLPLLHQPGLVFTPRQATELLVAAALELEPERIADVGTGSGAIAVALAVHAPETEIWATDICPWSVAAARANVQRYGLQDRVHILQADLLNGVPGDLDLVVANLPYLPDSERLPEYADEPANAVYAPGDGLAYYRRLLAGAERLLRPRGRVAIQYRGRVLEAERGELSTLREQLECPTWVVS